MLPISILSFLPYFTSFEALRKQTFCYPAVYATFCRADVFVAEKLLDGAGAITFWGRALIYWHKSFLNLEALPFAIFSPRLTDWLAVG